MDPVFIVAGLATIWLVALALIHRARTHRLVLVGGYLLLGLQGLSMLIVVATLSDAPYVDAGSRSWNGGPYEARLGWNPVIPHLLCINVLVATPLILASAPSWREFFLRLLATAFVLLLVQHVAAADRPSPCNSSDPRVTRLKACG